MKKNITGLFQIQWINKTDKTRGVEGEGEEIKELPPPFIEFPFFDLFILFSNFVSYNYGNLTFLFICLIYFLFMLSSIINF